VVRVRGRYAEELRGLVAGIDRLQAGVLDGDGLAGEVDRRGGVRPQVVLDEIGRRLRTVGQPPQQPVVVGLLGDQRLAARVLAAAVERGTR
jgi:hypothetical protein